MSDDWGLEELPQNSVEAEMAHAAEQLRQAAFGVAGTGEELRAAPPVDWPTPPALDAFFARTEGDIDWIWDTMLMRGSVNILGAYMKVGKSTLVMNIIRGLVEQQHLFSMGTHLRGKVFWFAPEDAERIIRYNLNHAGIRPEAYREKLVLVTKADAYLANLRNAEGPLQARWQDFKSALKRDGAEFVIFDTINTFSAYLGLDDENDNQKVTMLMDLVAELKDEGMTVLLTQHTGKASDRAGTLQSLRGASSYAALADQIMLLTTPGTDTKTTRRVLTIIGRTSVDSPSFLNLDYDKGSATYHRLPDDANMGSEPEAKMTILEDWLEKNPGAWSQTKLRESELRMGDHTLKRIFDELKKSKEPVGRLALDEFGRVILIED